MEGHCTVGLVADISTFTYEPLQDNSFRLLKLHPADGLESVSCEILHYVLDQAPSYKALSYTWGCSSFVKYPVKVGPQVLLVQKNLFLALQELSQQNVGFLWVDAMCINQSSDSERSIQVARMKHIFAGAEEVIAWLGPSTEDGKRTIQFMSEVTMAAKEAGIFFSRNRAWNAESSWLSEKTAAFLGNGHPNLEIAQRTAPSFSSYGSDPRYKADWSAVSQLHKRPYWTRVWIIQELVCAKKATLHWGGIIPLEVLVLFWGAWGLLHTEPCAANFQTAFAATGFLRPRMVYQLYGYVNLPFLNYPICGKLRLL
ncbi:heterokaryon incompatibility protein-domain-containing protein [Xylariaceae sp. AK1471]|nr:heterokaryon incompatibility protein-domain-containing protein [Xylariaceae sp. AK1471]